MEDDDRELIGRILNALEGIATELEEQNRISRENLRIYQEDVLVEYDGKPH